MEAECAILWKGSPRRTAQRTPGPPHSNLGSVQGRDKIASRHTVPPAVYPAFKYGTTNTQDKPTMLDIIFETNCAIWSISVLVPSPIYPTTHSLLDHLAEERVGRKEQVWASSATSIKKLASTFLYEFKAGPVCHAIFTSMPWVTLSYRER